MGVNTAGVVDGKVVQDFAKVLVSRIVATTGTMVVVVVEDTLVMAVIMGVGKVKVCRTISVLGVAVAVVIEDISDVGVVVEVVKVDKETLT